MISKIHYYDFSLMTSKHTVHTENKEDLNMTVDSSKREVINSNGQQNNSEPREKIRKGCKQRKRSKRLQTKEKIKKVLHTIQGILPSLILQTAYQQNQKTSNQKQLLDGLKGEIIDIRKTTNRSKKLRVNKKYYCYKVSCLYEVQKRDNLIS